MANIMLPTGPKHIRGHRRSNIRVCSEVPFFIKIPGRTFSPKDGAEPRHQSNISPLVASQEKWQKLGWRCSIPSHPIPEIDHPLQLFTITGRLKGQVSTCQAVS